MKGREITRRLRGRYFKKSLFLQTLCNVFTIRQIEEYRAGTFFITGAKLFEGRVE